MNPTTTEIEAIVRQVLSSLLASDPQFGAVTKSISEELVLETQVITLTDVKGKLTGKSTLRINPQTVVTPAARDFCRESRVSIVRNSVPSPSRQQGGAEQDVALPSSTNQSRRPQRLIIAGSSSLLASIAKQMCPIQAFVVDAVADDATALREIANGLRNGHQAGVLLAKSPYSTCWQAARDEKLRPVVVTQWSELQPALREVPTNLLILGVDRWNVAASCNAARYLFEHLRRAS